MWYNPGGIESTLTFGGIPDGAIQGVQYNSHKMVAVYDDWWKEEVWMLELDDIMYNGRSIKNSNVTHVVLNTKSPFIYLEKEDWNEFTNKVQEWAGLDCTVNQFTYCVSYDKTCDNFYSGLRDLEFTIDGTTYVIPPEGYTESNSEKGYACMLFVTLRHEVETIELGTYFLRNFVLSYRYDLGKINLGLNVNAPAGA